ncbi:hypothetical protein [Citrobacter koseri]|uniref:hypothetical protein n=1 Tax=Citrobacter koseri TaxID=545 RepID=UPI001FCAB8BA|nr:hypothetical protein [Citrobacter koseri]MDM9067017.1 hypothetical protein [Citrobacter koseri]MDM9081525.1 hypothetical protein [Citrobacter koseri]MDM9090088.1 hypothetical protein [Citrobacter koseri]MDM9095493.1 hypothetical protein [Citrobacter koseri]MDM9269890.1 hypothetical protein [Citrobacter koseri]
MKNKMVWFLGGLLLAAGNNALAGRADTAGGRQAQQMLSSDMERHTTARGVIADVSSTQTRQQQKLALQMQIDQLRSELGGTTDSTRQQTLTQ